jgi:hypothetical protein
LHNREYRSQKKNIDHTNARLAASIIIMRIT